MKTNIQFWSYLVQYFLEWEMFRIQSAEKIKTRFIFNNFFRKTYRLWDMWKNILEAGRSQMAIWHIRIKWWIPEARDTHSEYVIHIAFPLQQWLVENIPMLRQMHIVGLVVFAYGWQNMIIIV